MCLDFLETAGKTFFFCFAQNNIVTITTNFFSELRVEKKVQRHKGNNKLGGEVQSKKNWARVKMPIISLKESGINHYSKAQSDSYSMEWATEHTG